MKRFEVALSRNRSKNGIPEIREKKLHMVLSQPNRLLDNCFDSRQSLPRMVAKRHAMPSAFSCMVKSHKAQRFKS